MQVFVSGRLEIYYGNKICYYLFDADCTVCESSIFSLRLLFNEKTGKRHTIVTKESIIIKKESDIRIVESQRNYVIWHCIDGTFREKNALCKVSKALSNRFIEVRKSHLVNLDYILGIHRRDLSVDGEEYPIQIPINRLKTVKERIMNLLE